MLKAACRLPLTASLSLLKLTQFRIIKGYLHERQQVVRSLSSCASLRFDFVLGADLLRSRPCHLLGGIHMLAAVWLWQKFLSIVMWT